MSGTTEGKYDVIIVGAGVVGSALGYALGKQGRNTLVLERDLKEPDRIVGELLQPGGVKQLRTLGLEDCLKGIDSPDVYGYAVFLEGKPVRLEYPKENGKIQKGSSFHHGKFIMSLRKALQSVDKVTLKQGTVTGLLEEENKVVGVVYKTESNDIVNAYAPLTILCDGCNSNFRSKFIAEKPNATTSFVGVVVKDTPLPLPNHGHVFLTNTRPILAYQIGTHDTRFLVDVPNPLPSASNGDLQNFLLTQTTPQLPESLRAGFQEAVKTTRPRSMPNSRLDPHEAVRPGVLLLGDAFNMRHPLTGGGMTVGLSDAVVTRDLLTGVKDLSDTVAVTKVLKQLYVKRKGYSSTINILSWALYGVFTATNDPMLPEMRKACIAYLNLGGEFTKGPVSLLAGIRPYPMYLMAHFFAVALFGVCRVLFPFPTPRRIINSYRLLSAASNIVVPLVRSEKVLSFLPILCRMLFLTSRNKPAVSATAS